jgi:GNAT superfamily N-acetyltransferase
MLRSEEPGSRFDSADTETGVPLCPLPDGYWEVPKGKLATATVWLEMRHRPPGGAAQPLRLERMPAVITAEIRRVFTQIGAASLWDKTIELNTPRATPVPDPEAFLYFAYDESGRHVGVLELKKRAAAELTIEIEYLGLFPELTGRGLGKRLMAAALDAAWSFMPERIRLHTCNFDHPSALPFYLDCGFKPFAAGFQIMDDPRLRGVLPRATAPHVPLIDA